MRAVGLTSASTADSRVNAGGGRRSITLCIVKNDVSYKRQTRHRHSGSPTISGTIGGIPAGKGYTITLTATSAEGDTTFTGSATFDVTAGATTSVTLRLNGASKTGNGSVAVNGTINVNPRIDEVTVTPQTVFVGGSIKLLAVGSDPDAGPSPLSYYWSTTGGVIDNPIGPSATLTSATPGTFTINLTLSDGDATDTATTTVTLSGRLPAAVTVIDR